MKKADIQIGKFFVGGDNSWLREVVSINESEHVSWRSYSPFDGAPISHGTCSLEYMTKWTIRVATPQEIAKLRIDEAAQNQNLEMMRRIVDLLERMPDEVLLAEAERRGYRLVRSEE